MHCLLLNGGTHHHVGLIPDMLNRNDPRPAREQFDEHYQHGGGWRPMKGWTLRKDGSIVYPGDPPLEPLAVMHLRDELVMVYRSAFVAIVQRDGGFEVARMD